MSSQQSLEQWARDILDLAVREHLVRLPRKGEWGEADPHPQARSAGEIVAVANELKRMLMAHGRRAEMKASDTDGMTELVKHLRSMRRGSRGGGAYIKGELFVAIIDTLDHLQAELETCRLHRDAADLCQSCRHPKHAARCGALGEHCNVGGPQGLNLGCYCVEGYSHAPST